jgi:nitric oxide reductase activation protein
MQGVDLFSFLASAIAGRKMSVHKSIKDDDLAFSDGQSIIVPPRFCEADLWLHVAAQAALVAAGSLAPDMLRQLVGRKLRVQRYVYLEVLRAGQVFASQLPWAFTARLAPKLTDSAQASLTFAASEQPLPETPDFFGTIRPLMALSRAVREEGFSALTPKQQQGKMKKTDVKEFEEDEETETSFFLKLFQNPFSSGNPLSDMLNNLLGAGVSKGKQESKSEGAGAEMPVGRVERSLRRGVNAVLANLPFDLPEIDHETERQALVYPEWDIFNKTYHRNWVFLEEVDAWRQDGMQDLQDVLKPASRAFRQQLANLGLDYEMHRRQSEGADLDEGALIDCAIDLRTGHTPASTNIYRTGRRTRRDLAVAIVLDISGSTGGYNEPGNSIFHKHLLLAYQLAATLTTLGDTVALFGFHSWGRKLVRAVSLKSYDEPWSLRVAARMAMLEPVGYTRTGAAIRHGARLLRTGVRLPNRLLILITDGIVYDQDYEHKYAESDARKALEEAKAAGTACVCLSVGSGTDTSKLKEVFGAANILAVDEVSQVTGRIREMCRKALAGVSRRQLRNSGP